MLFRRARARGDERITRCRPEAGSLVWVVGDIHGQDELFETVLRAVVRDLEANEASRGVLILLGDYIDRGIGSRRVIDQILHLRERLEQIGAKFVTLMGNHEDLLLRFLEQPLSGPDWCNLGGRETLISYGVNVPDAIHTEGWHHAAAALIENMPRSHLEFFRTLPLCHTVGDYHCVHAGVRPGVALTDQKRDDMMWLRDAFLSDRRPFEKFIIHGHTPTPDVVWDDRRIGLDTGAYATGVLTALRLQADTRVLLQTRRTDNGVELSSRSALDVE